MSLLPYDIVEEPLIRGPKEPKMSIGELIHNREALTNQSILLPINKIHEDVDFNCRGKVTPIDVHDLIEDIKKIGLLQPVLVRKYSSEREQATGFPYGLVAGYRRTVACKTLGMSVIPAVIKYEMTDIDARLANLGENLIRKDLNVMQEALAIEKLRICGMTMQEIADRLHKSMGWVQIRCMALAFPKDAQEEIAKGVLAQNHIKELATLNKPALMDQFYEQIKSIKNKRLRGEKNLIIKKPISTNTKKARKPSEINNCLDFLYDNFGASLATRCLAWASGNISTKDLLESIEDEAKKKGINIELPTDDF